MASVGGNIRFEYQAQNDIYVIYPCCALITEDDCRAWFETYDAFFRPLGRRVDCILVLDMFSVGPGVSQVWQQYRARIHASYTRHTVRAYMGADEVAFIAKATNHQDCASSIGAAELMILRQRELATRAG